MNTLHRSSHILVLITASMLCSACVIGGSSSPFKNGLVYENTPQLSPAEYPPQGGIHVITNGEFLY